jgi:outer membrane protein insertion porin family/translocation and assembly module TamA
MAAGGLGRARARVLAAVALLGALSAAASPRAARAQDVQCDPGDVEVRGVRFRGNTHFSDAELALGIVTTPSTWEQRYLRVGGFRPFGTRRCLDRAELPRDVVRLVVFYRNRGYPDATVDTLVTPAGREAVAVTFSIVEGRPMRVDSLRVRGLEELTPAQTEAVARAFGGRMMRTPDSLAAAMLRTVPLRVGSPFDRTLLQVARDTLRRRLRNAGFPDADVLRQFRTDAAAHAARVDYTIVPGPLARVGQVIVTARGLRDSTPQIDPGTVRGLAGIRAGDLYRERDLERAKRSLYQTDSYRHVEVSVDSLRAGDSTVVVRVDVDEANMHSARVGFGGGTLDCGRASGELVDRDFLGGARRLELTARVSKIGSGEPLRIQDFNRICQQARQDPYSDTLNYYIGATLRQPVLFGLRTVPTVTLFRERRSEYKAFLRTTDIGGVASLTSTRFRSGPITTAYQLEYGKTTAQPALFCAVFNICEESARNSLSERKRSAVLSGTFVKDRTRPRAAANPTGGSIFRAELRHASKLILSDPDLVFNRGTVDGSLYIPTAGGNVLALRMRLGLVVGETPTLEAARQFIPPQERLYAGGANSVRGYRQNELGPAVYVLRETDIRVDTVSDTVLALGIPSDKVGSVRPLRAVPTGGNTLVVGSAEYRIRSPVLPQLLQFVTFMDVGEVWNRQGSEPVKFRNLKWTPGAGFRVFSPFGAFRMDVGYNAQEAPAGPAYLDRFTPNAGAVRQPLFCIVPGRTTEVVRREAQNPDGTTTFLGYEPRDEGATCEGAFRPPERGSFLRRLTFNFSIGQAF